MGQGLIQGWGTFFNNTFDEYNFSIISNLFDNNNSYAGTQVHRKLCQTGTHYTGTQKSKTCEKTASYRYSVKTSKLRAKNSNTICLKTCSRRTKMAIIECKISKIFRESMPPDPLKPLLSSFCFKLTQPENLRSKMSCFGALPLKKFWLRSWHENINFK